MVLYPCLKKGTDLVSETLFSIFRYPDDVQSQKPSDSGEDKDKINLYVSYCIPALRKVSFCCQSVYKLLCVTNSYGQGDNIGLLFAVKLGSRA
jgi:hypothetical protein